MKKVTQYEKGHKFTLTKIDLANVKRDQPKIKLDSIVTRGNGPLKQNVHGTKPKGA